MITLYTTPTCTHCRTAKAFLEQKQIDYQEKVLSPDDRKDIQRILEATGRVGVPALENEEGEIISGFEARKYAKHLGLS